MRREFSRFFTRKYILIIIPILLVLTLMSLDLFAFSGENSFTDSPYSEFISDVEPYDSREELQELYDAIYIPEPSAGYVYEDNFAEYKKLLYGFSLDHNLTYDSLVVADNFKYTQFHFFLYFSLYMCLFILLASVIIGSFYQTSDFLGKTAKLVYTSGEKRTKIIARKYFVSLLSLEGIILVVDVIFALLALRYSISGAKYLVFYADGNLYSFNFFQYVLFNVFSHMLMAAAIYTFIYYLSAVIKNGIITSCASLAVALLLIFTTSSFSPETPISGFLIMFTKGLAGVVTLAVPPSLSYVALYIPFIVIPLIMALAANKILKKSDYSR